MCTWIISRCRNSILIMLIEYSKLSNPFLASQFSDFISVIVLCFKMPDSDTSSKRGKLFGKNIHERFLVFAGDCELINEYLHDKGEQPVFLLLWYINSLLRSFGYVIFANNPFSGFIILVSVLAADSFAGLAAILCSTLAFLSALILKQDTLGNLNGFFGYNAVLLGTFSAGLLPKLYPGISADEPKFWLFLIFTAFISVYVTSALANLFRYLGQHPIPCFLLPFNLLQYILIFCLLNNSMPPTILSRHLLRAPARRGDNASLPVATTPEAIAFVTESNFDSGATALTEPPPPTSPAVVNGKKKKRNGRKEENPETLNVGQVSATLIRNVEFEPERNYSAEGSVINETRWKWGEVFSGTIVSVSQIYGLNYIPGSAFMLLALMIYSPTTTLFCYTGSVLGTIFGTNFASNPEEIYFGLWGYNGFLVGGALAGFGFVLTIQSTILAITAILFSTVLQHFLTSLFLMFDVPMFTIPFNLTAVLFLFVSSDSEKALSRPSNFSFPEKHRHEYNQHHKGQLEGYLRRARVSETYVSKDEV